jgi:cytochrome c oxidase subunit 2
MARLIHHRGLLLALALAMGALALLTACDAPQSTFSPKSDTAQRVHTLYILVIVMAALIGAGVIGTLLYALFRFRARPGRQATQTHGNIKLEIAWTIAPVLVLIMIGVPTIFAIARGASDPEPGAVTVTVTAHQWWWEIEYEGLGPEDPNSPGERLPLTTANEIHLPVGRQAAIIVESEDVIHSFWVPQLVGKVDAIPGRTAKLPVFTPQDVGVFLGQCAEFCGLSHAKMRFRVIVEPLADFNAWAQAVQTPPEPATGVAAQGQGLFLSKGCIICHTIQGMPGAAGKVGPDLSRFGSRLTLGAGVIENNPENLAKWINDPRDVKPLPSSEENPLSMPSFGRLPEGNPQHMTEAEIEQVSAFLESMRVE